MERELPQLAKTVLFNSEGDILLLKRRPGIDKRPGGIDFPGGAYEIDDIDFAATALRETFEEIGIEVDLLDHRQHLMSANDDQGHLYIFPAHTNQPENIQYLEEHASGGWHSLQESLSKVELESHRQALEHVANWMASRLCELHCSVQPEPALVDNSA